MSVHDRWETVRGLFLEALDLEGEARARFVHERCAGDGALREDLEGLLRSHVEGGVLEGSPTLEEMLGSTDAGEPLYAAGARIGKFEVVRLINSGGMGEVYLATRVDDYREQVAIKVMRLGLASTGMVRRFQRERQMLAVLDHPNISRLLDGGTTESGLPYLVMEYIDGGLITAHCRERGLSAREIVGLFLGACDAVRCAHQSLVIHRDIKPANVLITHDGVLKLLDFGVAGLIDPGPGGGDGLTVTTPAAMTLRYSSPEQVRGEPVTTATDVYSLGLVLYELLAGRAAYEDDGGPRYESERVICEEDPPTPSVTRRRAGGDVHGEGGARGEIPGDLDDIVMMAIRKRPGERYSSAEALAEDLGRFLAGEPVAAHHDSYAYRARKYVTRHKTGVAFGAIALVLVAGGVASTSVGMARARAAAVVAERERDEAIRARNEAEGVVRFLETMLASSSPFEREGDVTVYDLLRSADTLIRTRLVDQPDVAASVHKAMGRVYIGLFEYENAIPHLSAALEHDRGAHEPGSLRLAEDLSMLARARSDLVFTQDIDCRDTVAMQLEALEIRRGVLGEAHALVAENLGDLALAHWSQAPHQAASDKVVALYEQSLAMFERLGYGESAEIAEAGVGLGHAYASRGEDEAAGERFRRAVEIYRADETTTSQFTLNALNAYGAYLRRTGRRMEAVEVYTESIGRAPRHVVLQSTVDAAWERVICRDGSDEGAAFTGDMDEAVRLQSRLLADMYPDEAGALGGLVSRLDGVMTRGGAREAVREAFTEFARVLRGDSPLLSGLIGHLVGLGTARWGNAWTAETVESCAGAMGRDGAGDEAAVGALRALAARLRGGALGDP